tara:strand:+ start:79614 stop:79943 length:330 start_codon:yes stop_codon:yes gene_type:complete
MAKFTDYEFIVQNDTNNYHLSFILIRSDSVRTFENYYQAFYDRVCDEVYSHKDGGVFTIDGIEYHGACIKSDFSKTLFILGNTISIDDTCSTIKYFYGVVKDYVENLSK